MNTKYNNTDKHYLIILTEHEVYNEYHLRGTSFKDAIKKELHSKGQFDWFLEQQDIPAHLEKLYVDASVISFLKWLKDYPTEHVSVYESETEIKNVNLKNF
jgi:hypothetical protein